MTVSQLLARMQESGLLSSEEAVTARLESGAEDVLRRFLNAGTLTTYQVEVLAGRNDGPLTLAGYVVLKELGQGGMGRVFKARHRVMKRLVAIKVIRPHLLALPNAVQRFRREMEAAARVSHPNLVMAHDAGEADGRHFLVMEYCEGVTLSQLVDQRGPLSVGPACEVIRQAAWGLQHASERGLVHRDIKPSNIMICGGQVKILDLGLARLHEFVQTEQAGHLHTESGITLGTPDFVAPEQARDSRKADIRADIYSLGCTLYFLLSGSVPFPGGTNVEKILRHQSELPNLRMLGADVPPEVIEILKTMIAKDPAERFSAPGEVARALAPFAQQLERMNPESSAGFPSSSTLALRSTTGPIPSLASVTQQAAVAARSTLQRAVSTQPTSEVTTKNTGQDEFFVISTTSNGTLAERSTRGASRRRPWLLIGVGLGVLGLIGVAVWMTAPWQERPEKTANAKPKAGLARPVEVPTLVENAQVNSGEKLGDWPLLKKFGPHRATANAVAFSHDDRLLAVACGTEWETTPGTVELWNVATGESAGKLAGHTSDVLCVAFGPASRGHIVASGSGKYNVSKPGEVRLCNAETRAELATIRHFKTGVSGVAFSQDGSLLATSGSRTDHTVKIWRLDRLLSARSASADDPAEPALVATLSGMTVWISGVVFSPDGDTLIAGSGDSVWRWRVKDWSELPQLKIKRETGNIHRAAWSRDGRKVAAVTDCSFWPTPSRPPMVIAVWNIADPENPVIIEYAANLGGAAFLPDSNSLILGDQDGFLAKLDLQSGKLVWRQKVVGGWPSGLAISNNCQFIAARTFDDNVNLWRLK